MLNLAKTELNSLLSFTKQTTTKKISYERENFSLAYQLVQEPEQQHKQPQQKSLLASDTLKVVQEVGRSMLKRHRNLLPVPSFHTIRF